MLDQCNLCNLFIFSPVSDFWIARQSSRWKDSQKQRLTGEFGVHFGFVVCQVLTMSGDVSVCCCRGGLLIFCFCFSITDTKSSEIMKNYGIRHTLDGVKTHTKELWAAH